MKIALKIQEHLRVNVGGFLEQIVCDSLRANWLDARNSLNHSLYSEINELN